MRLLLKAIRSLPPKEQDEVLRTLLGRSLGESPSISGSMHRHVALEESLTGVMTSVTPGPPEDIVKQMSVSLLVRLPEHLHARFRKWSIEHGFSMAAVARGLVERFLDEQEPLSK
jgi:hypothetical protein